MRCDAPPPASPPRPTERGDTTSPAACRGKEHFEGLLRDKARTADDDGSPAEDNGGGACAIPFHAPFAQLLGEPLHDAVAALPAAAAPGLVAASAQAPAGPAAGEPCPSATVAALHAALEAGAPAAPLGATPGAPESTWEVSLHEPQGVHVELRATRAPSSPMAGTAVASWSLSVACPRLDRAVLARHAPRLEARLRGARQAATDWRLDDDGDDDDGA